MLPTQQLAPQRSRICHGMVANNVYNYTKAHSIISFNTLLMTLRQEMLFYKQSQAGSMQSIARLKSMGVPTQRPEVTPVFLY